jgi:hypothetical protein
MAYLKGRYANYLRAKPCNDCYAVDLNNKKVSVSYYRMFYIYLYEKDEGYTKRDIKTNHQS